jgi:hypothetical protein
MAISSTSSTEDSRATDESETMDRDLKRGTAAGLLRDRPIEHPEMTVPSRFATATPANDAAGENVHHDHDPVAFEQNRFAPKEVDAHKLSLACPMTASHEGPSPPGTGL